VWPASAEQPFPRFSFRPLCPPGPGDAEALLVWFEGCVEVTVASLLLSFSFAVLLGFPRSFSFSFFVAGLLGTYPVGPGGLNIMSYLRMVI
jgi:hypothetical protein